MSKDSPELGAIAVPPGETVSDSLLDTHSTIPEHPNGGSGHDSGGYQSLPVNMPEQDPKLLRPDEKYNCPVHGGLLREPVQTACGHRMCQECVGVYLGEAESKDCPAKEEDCEPVTRRNVFPDPGFRRELKQLLVFCPNENMGCKEHVKLSALQTHITECPFREVICIFSMRGCTESVLFKDAEKHQATCGFRPVACDLCNSEFNANTKKEHDTQICPEALVNCPYSCGRKPLKRRDLEDHKATCPRKPTECKFKSLGCVFTGNKDEVGKHEQDLASHFQVLLEYTTASKIQHREMQQELMATKQALEDTRRQIERQETSMKNLHKELKLKMVQHVERLLILEQRVQEIAPGASALPEIEQLKQSIEQLKTLIPQVAGHDRQVASHEIRMAEMDLRFQMIETASFDGKLLWKIRDYSHRKRDAVQGRTVSLYSQPFYSSRFGYKMCARVYLNGDGIGRGTHMSLYFVVMKGEYDALLPWPFQCKVSLILVDQSTERRHLKDDFHPDPTSTSFRRPMNAEMNVASGCPLFVAHTVLENTSNQYIKDDMLFIKVVVDTSGLQPI